MSLALSALGFLLLLWPPKLLRRDRALAALVGVYGLSAVSFLVSLNPIWTMLGDATRRPDTGIFVVFGCVVALLALQPVVLAYWTLPPEKARNRSRLCLVGGVAVILILGGLFLLLTPAGRASPQDFTADYLHTGVYQAYLTLYMSAYTVGEAVFAVGCWKAARRTHETAIARGLQIAGVGAVATLGYSAVRFAGVVAAVAGLKPPSPAVQNVAWICADGGTALTHIGFLIPTLVVYVVPRVLAWGRAYRDYRSLAPLWEALHQAVPTIALQPVRADSVWLRIWEPTWHLYRRSVEIRDGQWALQHWLEESVRDEADGRHRAAGLTGSELAFAVTAEQIRAALTVYGHGEPPATPAEYADAGIRGNVRTPDDDVRALLRIAAHFDVRAPKMETVSTWT